jgi:hypothetical protein
MTYLKFSKHLKQGKLSKIRRYKFLVWSR